MQLAITVIGLLTAFVALVGSYFEYRTGTNKTPPASRTRSVWLLGTAAAIAALSLLTAYVIIPAIRSEHPLATILSPKAGEKIKRPHLIDLSLTARVPDDLTVWLGYQNEEGGPYIVQRSKCTEVVKRLDCGPLYVGHDEKDPAAFRIFVATADASATASLSVQNTSGSAKPGDNHSLASLPAGTKVISEERHITLR